MTPSASLSFTKARWAWPAAALLLAQVALFAVLAPRGFEFTDEAFYLLNGLHWREFTAVYSLFGAFLELPLRLTGGSLPAMRVLSMLSLATSGAFLGHQVQRHSATQGGAPRLPAFAFWLVGAAGGLYFFGVLSTLRAPSYNTIALATSAVATGLLLRGIDSTTARSRMACAVAYGFVMGICGLCKGSTGFLVGCLHLAYFCAVNADWRFRTVGQHVAGVVVGLGMQLALLTMTHPGWIAALQAGASLFSYDTGGKLGGMVNDFRWDIQRMMRWSPVALAGLLAWAGLVRWFRLDSQPLLRWIVLLPVTVVSLLWMIPAQVSYWWPAALILVTALLLVQGVGLGTAALRPSSRRGVALSILLLSLPIAFSFGTNMSVLWHSQVAAMYVVLLLMVRFERLWQDRKLTMPMLGAAMCLLCLPPLLFQARTLLDTSFTYRLRTAMPSQNQQWKTSVGTVWVDSRTGMALSNLQGAAQRSGLAAGTPILDFTGDGPGLVLALSGRPVGVPWLVGGYPDSAMWAQRLLRSLPKEKLSGAWLLSSPDNPRAIPGWEALLHDRIGPQTHELAARLIVNSPSAWGKNPTPDATLCVWRPRSAIRLATQKLPDAASSCTSLVAQVLP